MILIVKNNAYEMSFVQLNIAMFKNPQIIIVYKTPIILIQAKMSWHTSPSHRLILDPGSYSIRLGTASNPTPLFNYDNFIAIDRQTGNKIWGSQLDSILDQTKLIYEKNNIRGVTVKFQYYVTMLDQLMSKMQMPKKTTGFYCEDYTITHPILPYHPRKIMQRHLEIYLQYYRFDGIYIDLSSQFMYNHAKQIYNKDLSQLNSKSSYSISDKYAIVVQSSQSATYITPFYQGKPVMKAIKRLDVGGRLLTNYLKEILSFRHLDLKNSDRLIKQIKEDLCFVSSNLMEDMRCKKGHFLKHFILPDDQLKKKGYAVDKLDQSIYTQHISLDKERFQIPEILFNPQDIGMDERGIVGGIFQSLKFSPEDVKHNYLQNIILTGGNTRFPNFTNRLYDEIKKNTFCWVTPMIYTVNNINAGYEAAVRATADNSYIDKLIMKDWYKEQGPNRVSCVVGY